MSKLFNLAAELVDYVIQRGSIPAGDGEEQTIRVLRCRRWVFQGVQERLISGRDLCLDAREIEQGFKVV